MTVNQTILTTEFVTVSRHADYPASPGRTAEALLVSARTGLADLANEAGGRLANAQFMVDLHPNSVTVVGWGDVIAISD